MKQLISDITTITGMKIDTFYTILVTVLVAIIPLLKNIILNVIKKKDVLLNLYRKEEKNYFYAIILLVEMFGFFVVILISVVFSAGICCLLVFINIEFFSIEFLNMLSIILCCFFALTISIILVRFVLFRMKFVRKKILKINNQKEKILIYAPVVIFNLLLINGLHFHNMFIVGGLEISFILAELIGLFVFKGKYVEYKYSNITIYTDTGVFDCKDISTIERKRNVVIIKNGDRIIHIRKNEICKVEFYGSPLIKLKEPIIDIKKLLKNI